MEEKLIKSKSRTKGGLVGYVNKLFREIEDICNKFETSKLTSLTSYKEIIQAEARKNYEFVGRS